MSCGHSRVVKLGIFFGGAEYRCLLCGQQGHGMNPRPEEHIKWNA